MCAVYISCAYEFSITAVWKRNSVTFTRPGFDDLVADHDRTSFVRARGTTVGMCRDRTLVWGTKSSWVCSDAHNATRECEHLAPEFYWYETASA
jgi:hypothetical protein